MSSYTEGQVHQLVDKLESQGFSADHITKLGQCGRLADIRAFLEGRADIVMKKAGATVLLLLPLFKNITVPAIAGKKTRDCFTDKSRYCYRHSDLYDWLPENQSEQPESKFSAQKLVQKGTFKQAVESFLGVVGDIQTLSRLLKEGGHTTTLPAIESLIEQQEVGEDVGLRTDGLANFFFVEDKEGGISVVYVYDGERRWVVLVFRLGHDLVCNADSRFFFRKSDNLSL